MNGGKKAWAEDCTVLLGEQSEFRKGRGSSDNIFVLKELVERHKKTLIGIYQKVVDAIR